jgi:hypothetical protein
MLEGKTIKNVNGFELMFPSVRIEFTDGTFLNLDFSASCSPDLDENEQIIVHQEYYCDIGYDNIEGNVEYNPDKLTD